MSNIWDNIDKIPLTGDRNGFEPGTHLCEVKSLRVEPSQNPSTPNKVYAKVDFVQVESGMEVGTVFEVAPDPYKYGRGDFKKLIATLTGLEPEQIDKKVMDNATGPAQSLRGKRVVVNAQQVSRTNKQGVLKTFIQLSYAPAEGSAPSAPSAPPPAPEEPKTFPPEGWKAHPKAAGWFYRTVNGQVEQLSEAALRAL